MANDNSVIPVARIEKAIVQFRGERVMLDSDLAELYGVETKVLVQAVKRNIDRFPKDFMFQLSDSEFDLLRSQIVTSNGRGGRRTRPYAFTEQGVAMLSSVLRSNAGLFIFICAVSVLLSQISSSTPCWSIVGQTRPSSGTGMVAAVD